MPATAPQRGLYRGHRRVYAFLCPACGFRFAAGQVECYVNAIRARRVRRYGRYISVRQLRMFIEVARSQIDWDSTWVTLDELYEIIELVAQMDNEDSMDVDNAPLAIQDVVDRLGNLNMT
ncbi:hypothetical protein FRC08_011306 [Ceratobasidium sp. 394]|nr:hypothetical protein FRC08_011306 [Ceratobasidium sp. 394]